MEYMKTIIGIIILLGIIFIRCDKSEKYDNIDVAYSSCPCDKNLIPLRSVEYKNILMFNSQKTSFDDAKNSSMKGDYASFVYFNPGSDTTNLYSIHGDMLGVGFICNFPGVASQWNIGSNGIPIYLNADEFELCEPIPSVANNSYANLTLKSLKLIKQ